ncbi:putative capsular polysaccharide synthesis family protein [Methyloligella solikamskensis]|uniref:Capsular polysaccharide synthesis family protein n=1 Tax=Methyloligella solikamskensis TaxID=1177756 RepID=A0ABW3JAE5_9HYPH
MSLDSDTRVAVYTMGKVASTSVSSSILAHGIPCADVHRLEPTRIVERLTPIVLRKRQPRTLAGHVAALFSKLDGSVRLPKHLTEAFEVLQQIRARKRFKIISLIREPVSRNISAVFQNMSPRLAGDEDAILEALRKYHVSTPDRWFTRDFNPVTGIDVFAEEHDRSADHFRFSKGQFDVVIIKTSATDERKSEIISDFLGTPIALHRANEAKNKWYRETYERLVAAPNQIRDAYIEECFQLKYFRAFFSDEERQAVADKFGYKGKV